ncbi:MBL fold metallo-hydrolase [Polycladidibacter hongkongensis]|uniref:MBL fold metallo-hydrolase n=1 Tax=Polycladidibacter hongkongensis TaxID=1647556 RepID=UPI0008372D7B|nr:MBL fold metallo-hydrolase [Pseudovibrio hongkongensis]
MEQDNSADVQPNLQISVVPVTPFQQNCSIIFSPATKKGVVIDPGGDVDVLLDAVAHLGVDVERILLTHGHLDHVGGAAELAEKLGVDVEGPHKADEPLIARVEEQSKQFGVEGLRTVSPNRWLEEGDSVTIAGLDFDVLHTPGHSLGHVVFYQPQMKLAISGDVLFAGSVGRTDLPGGDHATLIASIKDKLLPLGDDVAFLPGHGEASTFGEERASNPFLI